MEQELIPLASPGDDDGGLDLASYAQRAYLEYALSVVKGRALPDVADGQKPHTLFVTCSDSRLDPEAITQSGPGDIFVLRNAGNLVPPSGAERGGAVPAVGVSMSGCSGGARGRLLTVVIAVGGWFAGRNGGICRGRSEQWLEHPPSRGRGY